jgi:hypothetical protein
MHRSQDTLSVRISRIQRAIDKLHVRLRTLPSSQNDESLYAKTNLYVLKRSLRALDLERHRRGRSPLDLEIIPQQIVAQRRTRDEELHPSP